VALRKAILAQEKAKEEARLQERYQNPPWKVPVKAQGPWDEVNDPWSLAGAPALPMPVENSDEESLTPFFSHIGETGAIGKKTVVAGVEPFYGVRVKEWCVFLRIPLPVPFVSMLAWPLSLALVLCRTQLFAV
jgi:hypothetical protein